MITIALFYLVGAVCYIIGLFVGNYFSEDKQLTKESLPIKQQEPSWRTSWAVLQRLKNAATEPASINDGKNNRRELGDLYRTVLLSDLQELLHHAGVKKQKPPTLAQRQQYIDFYNKTDARFKAKETLARMLKVAEHPDNPLP